MTTACLLLLLLGTAVPTNAYHIDTATYPVAGTWVVAAGGAAVVCEQNGENLDLDGDGSDDIHIPPTPGIGGMCYVSTSFGAPTQPGVDDWSKMTVTNSGCFVVDPTVFARVANNANGLTFDPCLLQEFYYKELLAYWTSNGHVTFFVNDVDPLPSGTGSAFPIGTGNAPPSSATCNDVNTVCVG